VTKRSDKTLQLRGEATSTLPEGGSLAPASGPSQGVSGPTASVMPGTSLGGAFDGASRFDTEVALWNPPIRSADGELLFEKGILDSRTRDMGRNDAYIANGTALHKDSIVGATYMLNSKPASKILGLDETWEREFQEEVEELFGLWAESQTKWADAKGTKTFTDMVRLAVGLDVAGGEILASVEWIRDGDRRRMFNTAINFVDADRLSNENGMPNTKNLRNGVEMTDFGQPVAYHIRNGHPADYWNGVGAWDWTRVPAAKPWGRLQMIHLIDELRPEQTRGVSALVTALNEAKMTKGFRRVTLQNAVVNATYAASIESELPDEAVYQQLGSGDGIGKFITQYANAYLGAITQYAKKGRALTLDGFKIPHLYPGTKLQLRPAGTPGGVGTEFEDSLLRYISTALGISFEEFAHNYTNTNYSAIKAAGASTRRSMQSKKKRTADAFSTIVFMLWLEEAINKNIIKSMPRNAPSWYEGLNAEAYSRCEWIGAAFGQVDELKETQAASLRLNTNLSTLEIEAARLGLDWRALLKQKNAEKAYMQSLVSGDTSLWDDFVASTATQNKNMLNSTTGDTRSKGDGTGDGGSGNGTKKTKAK
jgi:lambda family phage portal protein